MENIYDIIVVSCSRTITNRRIVFEILDKYKTKKIYVGDAKGVDRSTFIYARKNKIDLKDFKPDWDRYRVKLHNPAGKIRTTDMIEKANKLSKYIYGIAIMENNSPGTFHAICTFNRLKIPHTIYNIKNGKIIYLEVSK